MQKLISFKRDEQASNVTKIILVVWLVVVGLNRDKLFNRIDSVPVEVEQVDESGEELTVNPVSDTAV